MPTTVLQSFLFEFYGASFPILYASDHRMYLALKDLCEALGLNFSGQMQRIQRDKALEGCLVEIEMLTPYQEGTRMRKVACLWVERLPYWLGTIDTSRVRPELEEKLIYYKKEMADALWAVFRSDIFPPEVLAELDTRLPMDRRRFLAAGDQMAAIRKEIAGVGERIGRVEQRLQDIEAHFQTAELVNPAQQQHMVEMVAAVAQVYYQHESGKVGKSACFAQVWNELKAHFMVPDYPLIPARRMPEVVQYLVGRFRYYASGQPLPEVFRRGDQPSLL